MTLKAKPQPIARIGGKRTVRGDGAEDIKLDQTPDSELPHDEVLMILMPRSVFDEFEGLGKEFDLGPNALMAYALSELKKTVDKRKAEKMEGNNNGS